METTPSEAKPIHFDTLSEGWNYYSTDDGWIIAVKSVMHKIVKSEQKDGIGRPIHTIFERPLVQILTPEEYNAITHQSGRK